MGYKKFKPSLRKSFEEKRKQLKVKIELSPFDSWFTFHLFKIVREILSVFFVISSVFAIYNIVGIFQIENPLEKLEKRYYFIVILCSVFFSLVFFLILRKMKLYYNEDSDAKKDEIKEDEQFNE